MIICLFVCLLLLRLEYEYEYEYESTTFLSYTHKFIVIMNESTLSRCRLSSFSCAILRLSCIFLFT